MKKQILLAALPVILIVLVFLGLNSTYVVEYNTFGIIKEFDRITWPTRKEIVKQVLKERKVKETTVLLNLQNKKLFTKVGKDSYKLAA